MRTLNRLSLARHGQAPRIYPLEAEHRVVRSG